MDSPSYIHSILSFYSNNNTSPPSPFYSNTSITAPPPSLSYSSSISPLFPSYDSPFYSTYNTNTPLYHHNLYGSENTERTLMNHNSNYPIFYGKEDAYWWILCTEKYFRTRRISDMDKMTVAAMAMRGEALKWWLCWSKCHPKLGWDDFTTHFLWQFKPEYREILPIPNEEKPESHLKEDSEKLTEEEKDEQPDEEKATPDSELLTSEKENAATIEVGSFISQETPPLTLVPKSSKDEAEPETEESSKFFTSEDKEEAKHSSLFHSMVKTPFVHFSHLSQNTLFEIFFSKIEIFGASTLIAIMPKASNRYEQIFAEIFLPLTSCDIGLPIFSGVEIFYAKPPPKPPDRGLVPHPPLLLAERPYQHFTLILETSSAYVFHSSYTLTGFHRKKKKKKFHRPSTTCQRVFSTNRSKICVHFFWPISTRQTLTHTLSARGPMSHPKLNCVPAVAHYPCASLLYFLVFYSAWLHGQKSRPSNCATAFYPPVINLALANMVFYELLPPLLTHHLDFAQHVFLYPVDLSMADPINELVEVDSNAFSICFLSNVAVTNSHAQPIQPLHTATYVALIGNFFKTWTIMELNASVMVIFIAKNQDMLRLVGFQYHAIIWLTRDWDPGGQILASTMIGYFRFKQWDPDENFLVFKVANCSQLKQWDPGGYLDGFTVLNSSQLQQWDPGDQILTSTRVSKSLHFKQWDPGIFVITSIFLQP